MIDFTKSPSSSTSAFPKRTSGPSTLARLPWALIGFLALCALIGSGLYLAEGNTPTEMGLPYWAIGIATLSLMVCGVVSLGTSNLRFLLMALSGMCLKFLVGFVSVMADGAGTDIGAHGAQSAAALTDALSVIGPWGSFLMPLCAAVIAVCSTYDGSSCAVDEEEDA